MGYGESFFSFSGDVPKERVTLGLPVITTDHALIHEGLAYSLTGTIASNTTKKAVIGLLPPAATAAAVTIDMTNATSDLTYTAKTAGSAGNKINVIHIDPSAPSQALSVEVRGNLIVVNLATGSNSAITSTAALVKAAVNASAEASAIVTCEDEGSGTGIVNATAATPLIGGKDAVYIHFKAVDFTAAADIVQFRIAENATFTGTAATFTPINKSRIGTPRTSAITVTGTLDATLTETSATTILTKTARGAAGGATRYSSSVTQGEEIVFKPGVQYLLIFTPTGATAIDYDFFWYEEEGA